MGKHYATAVRINGEIAYRLIHDRDGDVDLYETAKEAEMMVHTTEDGIVVDLEHILKE